MPPASEHSGGPRAWDDPDVRIATSVLDHLFRRLALDYSPYGKRAQLGTFSAGERTAQVADSDNDMDIEGLRGSVDATSVATDRSRPYRLTWVAPSSCWSCGWARPPTRRSA